MCECYFVFLLRRARTHPGRTRARAPPVTSRPPSVSPRSRSLLPHTHRGDRHQFYTERGYWYYTVYLSRTIPLRHQCDYRLHIQRCLVVGTTTVVIFSLSLTHTHTRARRVASHRFQLFSVTKRHTYRRTFFFFEIKIFCPSRPTDTSDGTPRFVEHDTRNRGSEQPASELPSER